MLLGNTARDSLTGAQPGWSVQAVREQPDMLGRPGLSYQLNSAGGQLMQAMTGANVERHLAVVIDGEVYLAPRLRTPVGGMGVISGQFDARELAVLRATLE